MTKITLYYDCLQKQTTFSFKLPPKEPDEDRRTADQQFIEDIPLLAKIANTSMVHLEEAANSNPLQPIYNERTYIEFHNLLCELLSRFKASLEELNKLSGTGKSEPPRLPAQVEVIKKALTTVRVLGRHLRVMARSSAIESHLQNISLLLDVSDQKSWTPRSDSNDTDFQLLKPYSMRKGEQVLPWQSYRDWLMLMVRYFDAASVLTEHVNNHPDAPVSITIVSPPVPDNKMLTWIELLGNERFFPTLVTESSGKDFIKFLRESDYPCDNNEATSDYAKFYKNLKGGPLHSGVGFYGKHHAEAYISSLLTFWFQSKGHVAPFSEGFDTLTPQAMHQIKDLLDKIKVGHSFITLSCITRIFADFKNRIANMPLECLNDAAPCALSCSNG
jgi:hypothetical protein